MRLCSLLMRAAIYCRISDDRTGEQAGVKRQEDDCRAFCAERRWKVGEVFVDNDVSAYSRRKRRPAYDSLLEAVKGGTVDAVVAWHLDRLYRRPVELEAVIELVEATGLIVATVTGGDYDLTTTDGRAMARVVTTFSRKESEDKSRRTKRKHAELAKEGRPVGSGRPFGYEDDRLAVRADEAVIVQEAARRVLAGESLRVVAWDLTNRGIRTPQGNRFTTTGLRRILLSARIAGLRSLGEDGPTSPAQWPAIVDELTHRHLRAVLGDRSRRVNWGAGPRRYLLTGLLFCGLCGTRLIARAHEQRKRCYVCASGPHVYGCGRLRVVAEPLEELVIERMFEVLDSPELVEALDATSEVTGERELLATIAAEEATLEQLARDHYNDKVIGRVEFLAARGGAQDRVDAARRLLAQRSERKASGAYIGDGAGLRARWDGMTLHQKRGVVEAMVERVDVGPARRGINRFDPERVPYEAMRWRL